MTDTVTASREMIHGGVWIQHHYEELFVPYRYPPRIPTNRNALLQSSCIQNHHVHNNAITTPASAVSYLASFIVMHLTTFDSRCNHFQGVRTKTVKKSARTIVEKYYPRLTLDFHTNKRLIDEIAITPSKRMRNKIAGFTTHLMRRIAKGPVRNISLKLQEEERERRLDFVPEVSALEQDTIAIDRETRDLLESMGFGNLNGVVVSDRQDRN